MKNIATFGGGCFWCTEAIFQHVKGVENVISGYAGNEDFKPSYNTIHNRPGYTESIQITFDDSIVTYAQLLDIFFHTHNPTTLNQQGNDVGEAYRSVIFTHDENQRTAAETIMDSLQSEFDNSIVTSIEPYTRFFNAEEYHQNYYNNNKNQQYCKLVIDPKIKKFLASEKYRDLLKV